ncbi:MAG: hypothetical protein GC190_18300 [Alphaproteobacteria bacterium]|nr:hypothetical protein [Alphaproteobacteria bacterium]
MYDLDHIGIADLASVVHRLADPWKAFALFRVFLDESGTHSASPITAIGGFIGSLAAWQSLEVRWSNALADCGGAAAFRSYDCQTGEGHFESIPQPIRLALVKRLAHVIADTEELLPVWSAVVNEDWDQTVSPKFRESFPEPIYLAFSEVAMRIASWSQTHGSGAPVALVYSEQEEFKEHIREIWDAYKREAPGANLNSFTTASYLKLIPLQAADLFAYEMNQEWQHREYGKFGEPPPLTIYERHPMHIIRQKMSVHWGGTFDAEAIRVAMARIAA